MDDDDDDVNGNVLSNEDIHEADIELNVKRDDDQTNAADDDTDPENYEMCDCVDEHGPTCACGGVHARALLQLRSFRTRPSTTRTNNG